MTQLAMPVPSVSRVLVPVDVLGGQGVPETIVRAFASVPIVLLGYHEIPDQTTPEHARSSFGDRARAELEELESVFEAAGCDVSTRLAFTHDRFETFERTAVDRDCDGVLLLNPSPVLERVLVAIRGDVNVDHIARLVASVVADTEIEITLFHVVSSDASTEDGTRCLESATVALEDWGVDRDRVETSIVDGKPTDAILDAAADHDMLVIGESRPSIRRRIFRDRAIRIARKTVDPVLVIRGEYLESDEE